MWYGSMTCGQQERKLHPDLGTLTYSYNTLGLLVIQTNGTPDYDPDPSRPKLTAWCQRVEPDMNEYLGL